MKAETKEKVIAGTETFICTLCGARVSLHTSNINSLRIVDRHPDRDGVNECESSGKNYTGTRIELPAAEQILTVEAAEQFLKENRAELGREFERQYPALNVGGFYNPKVAAVFGTEIEFTCHYTNFEREDDCWTWYFDTAKREFYN